MMIDIMSMLFIFVLVVLIAYSLLAALWLLQRWFL